MYLSNEEGRKQNPKKIKRMKLVRPKDEKINRLVGVYVVRIRFYWKDEPYL
jgi:hypothetical protein